MSASAVTIVVPTFNRAHLLRRTLQTLVVQTVRCPIIVCDDASDDDTAEICAALPGVKHVRNDRRLGLFANWNRALKQVTSEFVAIYHDDDLYEPEIVAKELAAFSRFPSAVMTHTGCAFIDDEDRIVATHKGGWPPLMSGDAFRRYVAGRLSSPVAAPSMMLRTSAIRAVGGFDERLQVSGDLAAIVALGREGDIAFVPEPLVAIRRRGRHANPHARFSWDIVHEHLAVAAATEREVRGRVRTRTRLRADAYVTTFLLREALAAHGSAPDATVLGYGLGLARRVARAYPVMHRHRAVLRWLRPPGRLLLIAVARLRERLDSFRATRSRA